MRMPPDLNGHGGSQRAWHLVEALRPHGDVHFVLVFRDDDRDCMETSLAPLEPLVASVTRINIAGWRATHGRQLRIFNAGLWELFRMRSPEAPLLSGEELRAIAAQLPVLRPDVIFAGRLCCAVILQSLAARGLLSSPLRLVDFDDLMSKFRTRQVRSAGSTYGPQRRALAHLDARIIAGQESAIARSWDAVSVCTEEDARSLRDLDARRVLRIPNIMHRDRLPPRTPDGRFRILFIGNLGFVANIAGLRAFIEDSWPLLRAAVPEAELAVVGMNPTSEVIELTSRHHVALHANVPSVEPFYAACDATITPILFGSGTRIKILESMAYGRPMVSTSVGAEGMGLEHGRHLLLADDMAGFADSLARLARDPVLRQRIAAEARAFQQAQYGPKAIASAVDEMIALGRGSATPMPLSA